MVCKCTYSAFSVCQSFTRAFFHNSLRWTRFFGLPSITSLYTLGMEWVLGSVLGVRVFAPQSRSKGENMRAAVVLTYHKDNIDRFEARHMLKRLKNSVAIDWYWYSNRHIFENLCGYRSLCQWCKCFLVEFYADPCPTCCWNLFDIRYPARTYFYIPVPSFLHAKRGDGGLPKSNTTHGVTFMENWPFPLPAIM